MAIKDPKEIGSAVRPEKAFCVTSQLVTAKSADGEHPLKVYHSGFSRFVFALLKSGKDKGSVTANIKIDDIADLLARSDYAFKKSMDFETQPKVKAESSSPAYTVKIASGNMKGKTPAEVLIENPENLTALRNQYKWLKENVQKYPKNKFQMDAIEDAAKLLEAGKLNKAESPAVAAPSIKLYEADLRPLIRKPREDGMCPVYGIKIYWHIGEDNPVEITIVNYYAPVVKKESGQINVDAAQKDMTTFKNISQRVTEAEWMNIVREIRANMRQFEMLNAKAVFADADEAEAESRRMSKN